MRSGFLLHFLSHVRPELLRPFLLVMEEDGSRSDKSNKIRKAIKKKATFWSSKSKQQTNKLSPDGKNSGGVDRLAIEHNKRMSLISRTLLRYPWYHGLVPKNEVELLVPRNRDWYVRISSEKGFRLFCLTTRAVDKVVNVQLFFEKQCWTYQPPWSKSRDWYPKLHNLIDKFTCNSRIETPVLRGQHHILHANIVVTQKKGAGQFGDVYRAMLHPSTSPKDHWIQCSVQKARGAMSPEQATKDFREAMLLRGIVHPNLATIHGIADLEDPVMVVYELVRGGYIKNYLSRHPSCAMEQLISYCADAASGMAHLASRNIVFRDLAARNCLLSDTGALKISNFSMALNNKNVQREARLPTAIVKWMSPETLTKGIFNEKTDVWSFGVLVWEILHRCSSEPLPLLANREAANAIAKGNVTLRAPKEAPELIENTMTMCLNRDPEKRPTFADILSSLRPDDTFNLLNLTCQTPPVAINSCRTAAISPKSLMVAVQPSPSTTTSPSMMTALTTPSPVATTPAIPSPKATTPTNVGPPLQKKDSDPKQRPTKEKTINDSVLGASPLPPTTPTNVGPPLLKKDSDPKQRPTKEKTINDSVLGALPPPSPKVKPKPPPVKAPARKPEEDDDESYDSVEENDNKSVSLYTEDTDVESALPVDRPRRKP
ncbi:unnamed protein product [Caenorhabditis auriculariae]|uniref:Protein kinase domain-containing protein n=1 Tax=Caenorhabditis auriculariae TaxID=2777116 RepID=A0A8S1H295_9PELO|nr:unnamed protein product [Caenorhabditis auriculariae]